MKSLFFKFQFVLLLAITQTMTAQINYFVPTWYKSSCDETPGTPVEIHVDIQNLAPGTDYVCELYENLDPSGYCNPNPTLSALIDVFPIGAGTPNQPIDVIFLSGMYEKGYYIRLYAVDPVTGAPVGERVECLYVRRGMNPFGSFTTVSQVTAVPFTEDCAFAQPSNLMNVFLAVSGGKQPYTFQWDYQNITTQDLSGVPKNQPSGYTVTISDVAGCATVESGITFEPQSANMSVQVQPFNNTAECYLDIEAEVLNGSYHFIYNWIEVNTGALHATTFAPFVSQLKSNTAYFVKIMSPSGCPLQTINFQTQPAINTVVGNIVSIGGVSGDPCTNAIYTNLTINALFGGAPYTYQVNGLTGAGAGCTTTLNNAASTVNISSLICGGITSQGIKVGCYEVTVTNAFGCSFTEKIQVGRNLNDVQFDATVKDEICGMEDGSIALAPAPGYSGSGLLYTWSQNTYAFGTVSSSGNQVTDLPAGIYTVTVSEVGSNIAYAHCAKVVSYTILNDGIDISSIFVAPACTLSVGIIEVNTTGADRNDIQFDWMGPNGFTASGLGLARLTNLDAGIYDVTLTYMNCTLTRSVNVLQRDMVVSHTSNVIYCGTANGSATVSVMSGGQDVSNQATYLWLHDGTTNRTHNNLLPGSYLVDVVYNGCVVTAYPIVMTNQNLPSSLNYHGYAMCNAATGAFNYQIPQLAINGNPYSSVFAVVGSNGVVLPHNPTNCPERIINYGQGITGECLPIGSYTLKVQVIHATNHDFACYQEINFDIVAYPHQPTYTVETDFALCGGSNGQASVIVTHGPLAVPLYEWTPLSGGAVLTGPTLVGLPPDDYSLEVSFPYPPFQFTACSLSIGTITIADEQPILNIDNIGCNPRSITLSSHLAGTHHTYSYTWVNPNGQVFSQGATNTFTNLSPGNYTISLTTDIPGCEKDISIDLSDGTLVVESLQNAVCGQGSEIIIALLDQNQQPILSIPDSKFIWDDIPNTGRVRNNLANGIYGLSVDIGYGCIVEADYAINNTPLEVNLVSITPDCSGNNGGAINVNTNKIGATLALKNDAGTIISTQTTTANFTGLAAGTYFLEIDGGSGCTTSRTYLVPGSFDLALQSEDPDCWDSNNGTVRSLVTNIHAPITSYVWAEDGSPLAISSFELINLPISNGLSGAIQYDLSVTDANGCSKVAQISLNVPTPLIIGFQTPTPNPTCDLTTTINGGTAPYSLVWYKELFDASGTNVLESDVFDAQNINGNSFFHTKVPATPSGQYRVHALDANGCTTEQTIVIAVPVRTTIPNYDLYYQWVKNVENPCNDCQESSVVTPIQANAQGIADNLFSQIKAITEEFEDALVQQYTCDDVNQLTDNAKVKYDLNYHHYTLYYYNLRDELVRTVPPQGVNLLSAAEVSDLKVYRENPTAVSLPPNYSPPMPDHKLITWYKTDGVGRNLGSHTPDGNDARYIYSNDGLLRFSQNEKQFTASPKRYSYILYDELRRPIEAGEAFMDGQGGSSGSGIHNMNQLENHQNDYNFPSSTVTKDEWVKTYYSEPHLIGSSPITYYAQAGGTAKSQRYLRNRVSYTETHQGLTMSFSYDPHGNVEWTRCFIPGLGDQYMAMDYDLISNNVKKVRYNEHSTERFFHRYEYDEQNRLTTVYTSHDDVIWDRDAAYSYYDHGPLARKEIGEDRIQGCDYSYTIQGWIKAINHPMLNRYQVDALTPSSNNDPGQDGISGVNAAVMEDVFGFALGYYEGDYNRQNAVQKAIRYDGNHNLYNGNIGHWANGTQQGGQNFQLGDKERLTQRSFRYDDLNRINRSTLQLVDVNDGNFNYQNTDQYETNYTYDANGNIQTLKRTAFADPVTGLAALIDDLEYTYGNNNLQNQLQRVIDHAGSQTTLGDIDDQYYKYDKIGNLIWIGNAPYSNGNGNGNGNANGKNHGHGIGLNNVNANNSATEYTEIEWYNTNKVQKVRIVKAGQPISEIEYQYGSDGNRCVKLHKPNINDPLTWEYTYYVRDASGNPLSTYKRTFEQNTASDDYSTKFRIIEQNLYGSDRLGMYRPEIELGSFTDATLSNVLAYSGLNNFDHLAATSDEFSRILDKKSFELTDHLGNVTTIVSDHKTGYFGNLVVGDEIRAKIQSYQQFYPFGWTMPGRSFESSNDYRFGFNGKENDKDWGNQLIQDYGFRLYNPAIGKFLSVDPLAPNFPWWTPYQFAGNCPIKFVDLDGKELWLNPIFLGNGGLTITTSSTIASEAAASAARFSPYLGPPPTNIPYIAPLPQTLPSPQVSTSSSGDVEVGGELAPPDINWDDFQNQQFENHKNEKGRGAGENPIDGNQQYRIDPNLQVIPRTESQTSSEEDDDESNYYYRELNFQDRLNYDMGLDLNPAGEGGDAADQVFGKPTKFISMSETKKGTRKFKSGNGLVRIDKRKLTNVVPHNNLLNTVKNTKKYNSQQKNRMILNAKEAEEVLNKGNIPRGAIELIENK